MVKFTIKGQLDGLNRYTSACRAGYHAGNGMKQKNQNIVIASLREAGIEPIKDKVCILYRWFEPNMRRDLDNIAFAKKFIQDALVTEGILTDDGWKNIGGFRDEFFVDRKHPHIEVCLYSEYEFKVLCGG